MGCPRCGGFMTQEPFYDHFEFVLRAVFASWHCVNCGESLDGVIVANRSQTRLADPVSPTEERSLCQSPLTGPLTH